MNSINRVLITGGTGFVGYWMQQTCPPNIDALYLNRVDYFKCVWAESKWDAIVHLAPLSPSYVLQKAPRVLFASSGAVYEGRTPYALNKREWERQCRESDADVVIARLFTFVGERLKNLYAVTHFIADAKAGKPIQVWGDGRTIRSYLYGSDLGTWMWKILLEGEGIYNVGSDFPYTILRLAQIVAEIIPAKIEFVNPHGPETRYLPDTERACELGCKRTIGLKEAIERVINASN